MKISTISIILGTILLLSTGAYFSFNHYSTPNQPQAKPEVLNRRNFFRQYKIKKNEQGEKLQLSASDAVPPILTYGIKHEINVSQNPNNLEKENIDITEITAQCDVQTIYDEEKDIFEIAISYSKIQKRKQMEDQTEDKQTRILQENDSSQEEQVNLSDGEKIHLLKDLRIQVEQQAQDCFYIARVQADSGELLSIYSEKAYDEDKTVTWITQQLVNDIFPELRENSYKVANIEEDNLGKAKVDYTQVQVDSNTISINKEYNSNDYLEVNIDQLAQPQVSYNRDVLVEQDSGITKKGNSDFEFQIGQNDSSDKLQAGEVAIEMLGKVNGRVKQNFWLIDNSKEDDVQVAQEMWRYRHSSDFIECKLSIKNKGEISLGNGEDVKIELVDFDEPTEIIEIEEEDYEKMMEQKKQRAEAEQQQNQLQMETPKQNKLRGGSLLYNQSNTLQSVSVFGSTISVILNMQAYSDKSQLQVDVKVNSRVIKTLINLSWEYCKPQFQDIIREQQDFVLFEAVYPLLGIIVIPVKASIRFQYGLSSYMQKNSNNCQFTIRPYLSSSLYADGQASIAGLISAGMYADGRFIDANLEFSDKSTLRDSFVSLEGNFRAFNLSIGVTYTKISCSLTRIFSRRLNERRQLSIFKKIKKSVHKVVRTAQTVAHTVQKVARAVVERIENICHREQGYYQILNKSSSPYNKTFWSQQYYH